MCTSKLTITQFFLELWEELQAGPQSGGSKNLTGGMSLEQVKDRTSSATGEDGGLFDEMVVAYSLRRKTAQDFLVSALAESHSKAFRSYIHRVQFTTVGDASVLGEPAYPACPSPEVIIY
jgi:hypothetical protein